MLGMELWKKSSGPLFESEVCNNFCVSYLKELISNCEQLEVIGKALNYVSYSQEVSNIPLSDTKRFRKEISSFLNAKIE